MGVIAGKKCETLAAEPMPEKARRAGVKTNADGVKWPRSR